MNTEESVDSKQTPHARADVTSAGWLAEVFCSLQGEGLYVGQRQVFLRTAGCSLGCRWCDTVNYKAPSSWRVFYGGDKTTLPNPTNAETASREVLRLARHTTPVDTVSVTGGEPLEQPDFVVETAKRISRAGLRVYLETNGVHDEAFAGILPFVDVVAMDVKLPSATGIDLWEQHHAFLSRIRGTAFDPALTPGNETSKRKDFFVKMVIDISSRLDEVEQACRVVAATSLKIPLVLQPESGTLLSGQTSVSDAREFRAVMEGCEREARAILESVRVIPQCHKILGVK